MFRTGPLRIVFLAALVGTVVGFARLDGLREDAPERREGPAVAAFGEACDAEAGRQFFVDLADHLVGVERAGGHAEPMPPLDELPPLPDDLLPADAAVAERPDVPGPF
ncbi:MAG: hypothetical protein IT429_15750 [Gemmataceae bacterium]|nr:hypothetical protein [Gemmataceae bacterium]